MLGAPPLGAHPPPSPEATAGSAGGTDVDVGRAAVLPPDITPPLSPVVSARFRAAVEAGLTQAAVATIPSADTEQQRLATVGACRTSDCLGRLATGLRVAWIFSPSVVRAGKNYKLRITLFDPKGAVTVDRADSCDICTLSEAVSRLRTLSQEAGAELRRRHVQQPRPDPPRRKVAPRPEPPRRKIRPTPPRPPVRPPPARVVPPPPAPLKPRPKPSIKQAAWMSGSLGLVSFVAGATLLGLDGRYTCEQEPARLQCPYRYKTGTAGAVFISLGGAALVASGVLFYYAYFRKTGRSESPRATLGVAPTRGGAFANAELRF